jgi:hypothetical protein
LHKFTRQNEAIGVSDFFNFDFHRCVLPRGMLPLYGLYNIVIRAVQHTMRYNGIG